MTDKQLTFKISSGLKNLIGRDLISDRYIAVFELVKNSFDANANKVIITYSEKNDGCIIISDDGCGMDYNDIISKWLFVAYSEKKPKNRDILSYRENFKRELAGAKGVGRFSCDRLGSKLKMITKKINDTYAHVVTVDWNKFEIDDNNEFMNIPVNYTTIDQLPNGSKSGTHLYITGLRESWGRDELLRLRRSLMKLISPDSNLTDDPFEITLLADSEKEKDDQLKKQKKRFFNPDRDLVNGPIKNDIFEKMNIKTTNIMVDISSDGKLITTSLSDRGEDIFSITEKNRQYSLLHNIHITVFYLNQLAKNNFTRQMGINPKNYGSVFIYKNGFRVNPYGESGQDFFGIDQRKAQGWKRFLGTREIMGRISIKGENTGFIETTSRAHGFINTPQVKLLTQFFIDKVLKVLEKYVVNLISWGEPLKSDPKHVISPEEIGDKIVSQFICNVDTEDVVSIHCNPEIIEKISKESNDSLTSTLKKLEAVAEKTQDNALLEIAGNVKKKTEAILEENIQLEKEKKEKEKALEKAKTDSEIRKRQVFFLSGAQNQNITNLLNGFHTIYTLTDAIKGNIDFFREELEKDGVMDEQLALEILAEIYQANEKARKLSDLAIHGNQALKQENVSDIFDYIKQYIDNGLADSGIVYHVTRASDDCECIFDPASISVILDNISSNSIKAGATELDIQISKCENSIKLKFIDNGIGLESDIDPEMLFEWGVTNNASKKGFGIGLYHIKQLVEEMEGTVSIDMTYRGGFCLIVELRR